VKRILKPISYVLAAVYFLVDAVFIAVAKPVSDWLAKHLVCSGNCGSGSDRLGHIHHSRCFQFL